MINYKYIFWDWNGTLLDDVNICLQSMNAILSKRNMPAVTLEKYQQIFDFPVIEYYKKLGFDFTKESFEDLSVEFINGYNNRLNEAVLREGSEDILTHFAEQGLEQVIISAMEQHMLNSLIDSHSIKQYFSSINGISNIYAKSKVHLAEEFIKVNNIKSEEILFIGDTVHDAEVALAIGCKAILLESGHHAHNRLSETSFPVVHDFKAVIGLMS